MARASTSKKSRRVKSIPRDTILFFSGLSGVVYETIFSGDERAQLLLLFGAMMGLPAFLRADEARGGKNEEDDQE